MKAKRLLWLMSHTTLRKFEVPMLIQMGYEVFCPKIFPLLDGSGSVSYEYDSTLTIPDDLLRLMNTVNFYSTVPVDIWNQINTYFDIAIFHFHAPQFKTILDHFQGVLMLHAFGQFENYSYSKFILDELGLGYFNKMLSMKGRFYFAQGYENLSDVECDLFKNKTIFTPIGMPDVSLKQEWISGDNRIFFVCPRINMSAYFLSVYKRFKEDFKDFDYLVGGVQPVKVEDPKVLGFTDDTKYNYLMTHMGAMFYHSQEPRHLHYHPLEAIRFGMPVLFMAGGLLDRMGGENLPGRCRSIKEARKKMKRLLHGDQKFIQEVVSAQPVLLKAFDPAFCAKHWEIAMEQVEQTVLSNQQDKSLQKVKRVAVILPAEYTGGVLDYAIRFVKCLLRGSRESGDVLEVVFAYLKHKNYESKHHLEPLVELGISLRECVWQDISSTDLNTYYSLQGVPLKADLNENVMYFCDGGNNLEDCEHWFFMSDLVPNTVFTPRPYTVVAHDFIQRYIPAMYQDYYEYARIKLLREAAKVLVTSIPTGQDAISYGGIPEEKVSLTPLLFDSIKIPEYAAAEPEKAEDYFYWSTNLSEHKNHKHMLEALSEYYASGGSLKCRISGTGTLQMDPKHAADLSMATPYTLEVRNIIAADVSLGKNLMFLGNMPKNRFFQILSRAKFIVHPGYADNGNGTIVDAAFLGVPALCSDYPAARYLSSFCGLHMKFFDPFSPKEIVKLLFESEYSCLEDTRRLPCYDDLVKCTVEHTYLGLFDVIKELI